MVEIRQVNTENKKEVKEFVQFHYDLYKDCPQWVHSAMTSKSC